MKSSSLYRNLLLILWRRQLDSVKKYKYETQQTVKSFVILHDTGPEVGSSFTEALEYSLNCRKSRTNSPHCISLTVPIFNYFQNPDTFFRGWRHDDFTIIKFISQGLHIYNIFYYKTKTNAKQLVWIFWYQIQLHLSTY